MSESVPATDSPPSFDEQRIGRALAIALPVVTIVIAIGVGVAVGPATSILVVAAGLLLGVIAILWSSLRILSGDLPLSPEIEALDMEAQGVDALASRKKMLLRALKDLEGEHAIGKIESEDFEQISLTYRAELRDVLVRIDESLAPHRAKAEEAVKKHLRKVGLPEDGESPAASVDAPGIAETPSVDAPGIAETAPAAPVAKRATRTKPRSGTRLSCPSCGESNEPDAKFCKGCATKLAGGSPSEDARRAKTEDSDDA